MSATELDVKIKNTNTGQEAEISAFLTDDGTLDTVISVYCGELDVAREVRFNYQTSSDLHDIVEAESDNDMACYDCFVEQCLYEAAEQIFEDEIPIEWEWVGHF